MRFVYHIFSLLKYTLLITYNMVRFSIFHSMKKVKKIKSELKKTVWVLYPRPRLKRNYDVNTMKVAEWLIEVFYNFEFIQQCSVFCSLRLRYKKFIISLLYRKKQLYFDTKKYYYINMYIWERICMNRKNNFHHKWMTLPPQLNKR